MTITGGPSSRSDSPNLRLKKSGIQNRYTHQIGSVMNFAVATAHVWRWGSSVFQATWTAGSGGSAAMYARSAASSRGWRSGGSYTVHHSASHANPTTPVAMKAIGHP